MKQNRIELFRNLKTTGLKKTYQEFVKTYFSDEDGVKKLWDVLINDGVFKKSLKDFYLTYSCDLEWAKNTTFCKTDEFKYGGKESPLSGANSTPASNTQTPNQNQNTNQNTKKLPQAPSIEYFNKLNIDLTKPEQVDTLNNIVRQVNRFIREGGRGTNIRDFVYFTNELQKDPMYKVYTGVTGQNVQKVFPLTPPAEIIQGYLDTTNDTWDVYSDPDPDEMNNFIEQTYTINGVPFKFYKWKGSSESIGNVDVGYDPKKCYENLNKYIQIISDPSTTPSEQKLKNNKRYVEKCYGRFWYNSQLNDRDESGKIRLNLPLLASKNEVQDKLRKLMNRQDETGIRFTDGIQESLKNRLRNSLLESIERKKKVTVESEIIKSRISALINENLDYSKKENQLVLMEEVSDEIVELKSNGYNMNLVNENFFQWLSSFLGTKEGDSKEYITNWFIKQFGIEPSTQLSDSISKALDEVPESDYGKLFSDCDYTSDLLSKALVEAMMKQLEEDPKSAEAVSGMFNHSIIDTLNQDKISISKRMKEKIHNYVCEKLNKVHINMENTKNGIIDKALS